MSKFFTKEQAGLFARTILDWGEGFNYYVVTDGRTVWLMVEDGRGRRDIDTVDTSYNKKSEKVLVKPIDLRKGYSSRGKLVLYKLREEIHETVRILMGHVRRLMEREEEKSVRELYKKHQRRNQQYARKKKQQVYEKEDDGLEL